MEFNPRSLFAVGSRVDIWSRTEQRWFDGVATSVSHAVGGEELVTVVYPAADPTTEKVIPARHEHIQPRPSPEEPSLVDFRRGQIQQQDLPVHAASRSSLDPGMATVPPRTVDAIVAFIATDVEFPKMGTDAGSRLIENQAACSTIGPPPLWVDNVDVFNARWRLFESVPDAPAKRLLGLSPLDVKLVIAEHVWPTTHMQDRESFHVRILTALASQWSHAAVIMVQRSAGLGGWESSLRDIHTNFKKRKVLVRSVRLHYTPLRMNPNEPTPITGTETDAAVIILPKVCNTVIPWFLFLRTLQAQEEVHIPTVCKYIMEEMNGSVVQLAAFSGESTLAIMNFLAAPGQMPPRV